MLLTRTPLYLEDCSPVLARLACVKRAASVDSEPGSNSRLIVGFAALDSRAPRPILAVSASAHQNRAASSSRPVDPQNRSDVLSFLSLLRVASN